MRQENVLHATSSPAGGNLAQALHAECVRATSLPWTWACMVCLLFASTVPAAFARMMLSTGDGGSHRLPPSLGLTLGATVCALLGCLLADQNIRSGEDVPVLLAIPRRSVLAAARICTLTAMAIIAATIVFLFDRTIRTFTDPEPDAGIASPRAFIVLAGCMAAYIAFVMIGFLLTTLLRHAMLSMSIIVLVPLLLMPWLENISPLFNWLLPFHPADVVLQAEAEGMTVAHGFLAMLLWWAVCVVIYWQRLTRSDISGQQ